MLQGECLRDTGQHDKALAVFRNAARENPRSAIPVANIATALDKLGRKDDAATEFRRALALDPAQAESAAGLARGLRESGDGKGALDVLDGAIAAGCHAPAVVLERGVTLAELGRLSEAFVSLREAARREPRNPVPLENAARAAYQLEQYAESARIYEQLLRLTPGRGAVWKTLGAIYVSHLDDRRNARRAFREALRLEDDAADRAELEAILRELGPDE
jgi:tetratricopeptide (TPR) repeat protein